MVRAGEVIERDDGVLVVEPLGSTPGFEVRRTGERSFEAKGAFALEYNERQWLLFDEQRVVCGVFQRSPEGIDIREERGGPVKWTVRPDARGRFTLLRAGRVEVSAPKGWEQDAHLAALALEPGEPLGALERAALAWALERALGRPETRGEDAAATK